MAEARTRAKTKTKAADTAEEGEQQKETGQEVERRATTNSFLAEYGAKSDLVHLELPADLPFEKFQEIAAKLGVVSAAMPWMIGDANLFAELAYGESAAQAMDGFGIAYQTLANYTSVARRVYPGVRRDDLSWGHHQAVANLTRTSKGVEIPDERAQRYWLGLAVEKKWSRAELREALRQAGKFGSGKDKGAEGAEGAEGEQETQESGTSATQQEQVAPESLTEALNVIRDVFDAAVPMSMVEEAAGYYAIPPDAMIEMANVLEEEFVMPGGGDFTPPAPAGDEQEVEFEGPPLAETVEQLSGGNGAEAVAPPPLGQPQTTRHGTVVLDPTMVRTGPPPPGGQETPKVQRQEPETIEAGGTFEGFDS